MPPYDVVPHKQSLVKPALLSKMHGFAGFLRVFGDSRLKLKINFYTLKMRYTKKIVA